MITTSEIRNLFLNYFESKQHAIVSSSSLVPANDPTLLFTNAGMVQFKDIFLGLEKRSYTRATTAQKCVRAGGKHNDLENVGYTARHHTFFEMLGNFSFGDYFKREAINYAWDFLINILKLPKDKLWITVYLEDQEAEAIWLNEIKIDPKKFSRCGMKSNFWAMGDTGPCGPCSEIFYDHGESIPGGPPGSPDEEGDRYVEIWNLVFMQYNRDSSGNLTPLPKPSVDTGMGLERIAAILQNKHSNYEIDLFQNLIKQAANFTHQSDLNHPSLKVIADHIRSCVFLISDGVVPSNEGRGYVLRRIIRRALRHGYQLGQEKPFFYQLAQILADTMGDAYPELIKNQEFIQKIILQEEQQFSRTLSQGMKLLEQEMIKTKKANLCLSGEVLFKLYDTYGFPLDLTVAIAKENNLSIDQDGFEKAMEVQREKSQAAGNFDSQANWLTIHPETEFTGYVMHAHEAKVIALFKDKMPIDQLKQGEVGCVILNRSPFYAESGGQISDVGEISFNGDGLGHVKNAQKIGPTWLHEIAIIEGVLKKGDRVDTQINVLRRLAIARSHSAAHLLHSALRKILGDHVVQKGSLVEADRLRFDFSHFQALSIAEKHAIENLVNQFVRENLSIETELTSPEMAKKKGAMALFGEKYGEVVRLVKMGNTSLELCGGTHVNQTGQIGFFKLLVETSIASGIRRIDAIVGEKAVVWAQETELQLYHATQILNTDPSALSEKISGLLTQRRELERTIEQLSKEAAKNQIDHLIQQAKRIHNTSLLTYVFKPTDSTDSIDLKKLRLFIELAKDRLQTSFVIAFAAISKDSVQILISVSKDLSGQFHAGKLLQQISPDINGKGGGKADFAQGGGKNPDGLLQAFEHLEQILQSN